MQRGKKRSRNVRLTTLQSTSNSNIHDVAEMSKLNWHRIATSMRRRWSFWRRTLDRSTYTAGRHFDVILSADNDGLFGASFRRIFDSRQKRKPHDAIITLGYCLFWQPATFLLMVTCEIALANKDWLIDWRTKRTSIWYLRDVAWRQESVEFLAGHRLFQNNDNSDDD